MQKKSSIPTPLFDATKRKPVEIVEAPAPDRHRLLGILGFIVHSTITWWKASLQLVFTGRTDVRKNAIQIRTFLERMGGMWVKAGQLVSLRRDLFRPETCDELSRLQDNARGFPWELARRTIEEDLGCPIDVVFSELNTEPLAAASIGQVYEGTLREGGVRVVVKVQRPHVATTFVRDLSYLWIAARWLERLGVAQQGRWKEMMWELEKTLVEELDYRMEATSIKRMRKNLRAHKVYAPKVFEKYSSRRVLVMEFVDGVFMSEYIKAAQQDPAQLQRWRADNNIDPKKVGERLFLMHQRQMIEDNFFHCDLHPGNIVLLRNSRFALIDFGSVGSVEKTRRRRYSMLYSALAEGDYDKMADIFLLQSPPLPNNRDMSAYKADIVRVIRRWEPLTSIKSIPYHQKSMGAVYGELAQVSQRHGIPAAWDFLTMSRAEFTLDASLMYLCPQIDYIKITRKYNNQARRRALRQATKRGSIMGGLGKLAMAAELPTQLAENMFHEGEWLRRRALSFEGRISRFARFAQGILGLLSFAALVTITLGVGAYLRRRPGESTSWGPRWLGELLEALPPLGPEVWVVVGIAGVYLFKKLAQIRSYVNEREYEHAGHAR